MPGYKLSNTTCAKSCLSGFGPTASPLICVWCDPKCSSSSCSNVFDNCTSCTAGGANTAYLTTIGTSYPKCLAECLAGQYASSADQACHLCDSSCVKCINSSTTCLQCANNFGWLNYACYTVCADGLFLESNTVNANYVNCPTCYNCTTCDAICLTCTGVKTQCTACPISGANTAYLLGSTCVGTCPNGYFNNNNGGTGPNLCSTCSTGCRICTNNAANCSLCNSGYYFYQYTCVTICPTGYFGHITTRMCLSNSFSVNMTMKMSFTNSS